MLTTFSGTTIMFVKRLLIVITITTSATFPKPVLLFPVILHLAQWITRKLTFITVQWELSLFEYFCITPNKGDWGPKHWCSAWSWLKLV